MFLLPSKSHSRGSVDGGRLLSMVNDEAIQADSFAMPVPYDSPRCSFFGAAVQHLLKFPAYFFEPPHTLVQAFATSHTWL